MITLSHSGNENPMSGQIKLNTEVLMRERTIGKILTSKGKEKYLNKMGHLIAFALFNLL